MEFEGSGHIPLILVGMLIINPTYLPPELGIRCPLQFALSYSILNKVTSSLSLKVNGTYCVACRLVSLLLCLPYGDR